MINMDILDWIGLIAVFFLAIAWIPQIYQGYKNKNQPINKYTMMIYLSAGSYLSFYNFFYFSLVNFLLNASIVCCVLIIAVQNIYYRNSSILW